MAGRDKKPDFADAPVLPLNPAMTNNDVRIDEEVLRRNEEDLSADREARFEARLNRLLAETR